MVWVAKRKAVRARARGGGEEGKVSDEEGKCCYWDDRCITLGLCGYEWMWGVRGVGGGI